MVEQLARCHLECASQLLNHCDRRVACTPLNVADIGPVNPCIVCQRFLTEAQLETKMPHVPTEANTNIHPVT